MKLSIIIIIICLLIGCGKKSDPVYQGTNIEFNQNKKI